MNDKDIFALESIEYLENYNEYVFSNIYKNFGNFPQLDFGCGFGTFIKYINEVYDEKVLGYEINELAIKTLRNRNIELITNIESYTSKFETIISMNVLEHVEDDLFIMKQFYKLLKPGGILILYLPHSNFLWSNLDELVDHHRRYTKKDLIFKLEKAGFKISKVKYFDFIGSIVITLSKLLNLKLNFSKKRLLFYDKYFFKYLKFLDIIFQNLFGKNILIVAEKEIV